MAQERFQNYLVEGQVSEDAFGTVYDARREDELRSFHLRVLSPPASFEPFLDSLRARFEEEAHLLERLASRCTAEVLDVGVQGGELYIVSEPAVGRTLREVIADEGPLTESRVRAITGKVLESLNEAHNLGLPHGGLSPDEVVIDTDTGGDDRVTVRHHGLAWLLRGDGLQGDELPNLQGKVVGPPQYAAPERFRGDATFAADVYAVGLLMWEMLTGEPAVSCTEPSECLEAQLGPEPWLLPATLFLSEQFRDVVHKALQRHPRKRFVDAARMLEALSGAQKPPTTHALGLEEDSMIDPNVDSSQTPDLLSFGLPDDDFDADSDSEFDSDSEPSADLASESIDRAMSEAEEAAAPRPSFVPRPRELTPIELDEQVLAKQRAQTRGRERTGREEAERPPTISRRPSKNSGTPVSFVVVIIAVVLLGAYLLWGQGSEEEALQPPPVVVVAETEVPAEPSRFSPSDILGAAADAGWKSSGARDSTAAEGVFRHVYALRRGDDRLQMQVYVTESNADANRMGVETKPPAVSVVLDEKLVRLVPPPNTDGAAAIELARDLTEFRNQAAP